MKITRLSQYHQNAKRFTEIASVLGRYGLARFIGANDPEFVQKHFKTVDGERIADLSLGARLRSAFTELGTTFIKLGQILSTREDLAGPEVARELAGLQSNVPADPPEVVRATIEAELGQPVEEVFASFEDVPMASASIAQAHRADLPDGTRVVVKVQHPDIEQRIIQDMEILEALATLAERHDEQLARFQPRAAVAEFRRSLMRELDFGREARNLELFGRNFAKDELTRIPGVYPDRSSRRVLTMDQLVGKSVASVEQQEATGIDTKAFVLHGANVFLEMVFRDGVYHADPHPGNIFILEGGRMGLLDFGMVGRIDAALREELETVLISVLEEDGDELTRSVMSLGTVPLGLDRAALRADIEEFLGEYGSAEVEKLDLSRALTDLTDVIRRHNIFLSANASMLLRLLVMLEGTSRGLDRSFSLAEVIEPYTQKIAQRRFGPQRLMSAARRSARDWKRLLDAAPRELSEILSLVSEGKFDVNLAHRRLDPSINKLVVGILTAALFLGSSRLWAASVPPIAAGVSLPGVLGVAGSIYLGWRLLRVVKRSQNLD